MLIIRIPLSAVILFISKFSSFSPPTLNNCEWKLCHNNAFVIDQQQNTLQYRTPSLSAPLISLIRIRSYVCLCVKACRCRRSRSKSALTAIHHMHFVVRHAHFLLYSFRRNTSSKVLYEKICSVSGMSFYYQKICVSPRLIAVIVLTMAYFMAVNVHLRVRNFAASNDICARLFKAGSLNRDPSYPEVMARSDSGIWKPAGCSLHYHTIK